MYKYQSDTKTNFSFAYDFYLAIKKALSETNPEQGFHYTILAMTYFHMGKPHTIIGDDTFHC